MIARTTRPSAGLLRAPSRAGSHARFDKRLQQLHQREVVNLTPAGRALQYFANEHVASLPGCGFLDGGCWALGEALAQYLVTYGVETHLVAVGRPSHVDHVAARIAGGARAPLYADADGVGSRDDLLVKMRALEHVSDPTLAPFDPQRAHEETLRLFRGLHLVERLNEELHVWFGDRLARHLRHWPTLEALNAPRLRP